MVSANRRTSTAIFLYAATLLVDFNVSACPEVLSLKKPPRNEEQLVLS